MSLNLVIRHRRQISIPADNRDSGNIAVRCAAQVVRKAQAGVSDFSLFRDAVQQLFVHGWIYDMETGLMNDLGVDVEQHR